jgi:hypothetical protein
VRMHVVESEQFARGEGTTRVTKLAMYVAHAHVGVRGRCWAAAFPIGLPGRRLVGNRDLEPCVERFYLCEGAERGIPRV